MLTFLGRRLLFTTLTFFAVVTLVFFLVRAAPGGPFDGERRLPPEIEQNLKAAYDLDAPVAVQYARFLARLVRGDLGPSFKQKDFTVNELIAAGLPLSATLGASALVFALLFGTGIGVLAGLQPGSRLDGTLMAMSNVTLAVPTIVTAPLLVLAFSVALAWFPAGGAGGWRHLLLPAIALGLPFAAEMARLMRGGIAEVRNDPHVITARAKGLSTPRIVARHMLPIAAVPCIAYLAPASAALLTGSVVVEQVFDLPGIGRYFVDAALSRDYTLVMGVTIVYAFAILLLNLAADLACGALDPRIRAAQLPVPD